MQTCLSYFSILLGFDTRDADAPDTLALVEDRQTTLYRDATQCCDPGSLSYDRFQHFCWEARIPGASRLLDRSAHACGRCVIEPRNHNRRTAVVHHGDRDGPVLLPRVRERRTNDALRVGQVQTMTSANGRVLL